MISNGAFTLSNWRIQDYILLTRNEKYWDDANTTLSEVYYYPLDNPDASLRRYRANELDFTDTTPSEQLPWIKQNLNDELNITPYFGSYYYGFNNTKPPFKNNPQLRNGPLSVYKQRHYHRRGFWGRDKYLCIHIYSSCKGIKGKNLRGQT